MRPSPLTTEQAAQRLWTVRRLLRAGAMDAQAAATTFELLRQHPNPRISTAAEAPLSFTPQEFAR
jgi:hypothetical protein